MSQREMCADAYWIQRLWRCSYSSRISDSRLCRYEVLTLGSHRGETAVFTIVNGACW